MADLIQHFSGDRLGLTEKIREYDNLVLIDFSATWCGPCRKLSMALPSIASNNIDVTIIKIDIDENEDLAAEFGVTLIPRILFVKKDAKTYTVLDEFIGCDIPRIKEDIEKFR
ncbi:Thioredoxin family protein [Trichomonas vaginalis G3]|uniref:Thioredoxin family protein n=1 Tax=Trichomonas vaginalis (strain ATCC PRA-98 / G3) TaxID=412133 RepID=A2FJ64_TRIV3|nr:cell redox homeostasis [Trichomonas vaginalis G3]EAX95071.1 Thioredoxin family protein [Trichomonas vaginalis G3]KAI5484687.1 cell redox homeostasis [Trichomonas vaginalis G3]|eukprot:XP_001308001.1 Thioredoxin family protein [Trichomonas vaginalis G3]